MLLYIRILEYNGLLYIWNTTVDYFILIDYHLTGNWRKKRLSAQGH